MKPIFRLQENHATPYGADYWTDIPGRYTTLDEAHVALVSLEALRYRPGDLRVHVTPEDASEAILEAQRVSQEAPDCGNVRCPCCDNDLFCARCYNE